jgi:N-methylhydantoinase A
MHLGDSLRLSFVAAMRFVGQAFEVPVELPEADIDGLTAERLRGLFGAVHQKLFFFGAEAAKPIEFVSFRLGLTAPLADIPLLKEPGEPGIEPHVIDIFDGRAWHKAQFRSRNGLPLNEPVAGPALLDDPTSTLLVPAGWQAQRDVNDNVILTHKEQ